MTPMRFLPPEKAAESDPTVSVPAAIAWSSFFFALLQSVCTFFAAANGLRFILGIGSLAIGASVGAMMDRFHTDALRVPMIGLALVGSLLNLAILAQVRRLRGRPASQWRRQLPSPRKHRTERLQIVLSVATLVLVAVEEIFHVGFAGHL